MSESEVVGVPDLGGARDVEVIEILVKVGDTIEKDAPLLTLESEKASMEVPAPFGGVVTSIHLKCGDKISKGDAILDLKTSNTAAQPIASAPSIPTVPPLSTHVPEESPEKTKEGSDAIYAGPGVRRLAYELDLDLTALIGTGKKERITKEDIQTYVKSRLASAESGRLPLSTAPKIDYSQWGTINLMPLNKVKRLTAVNLHRSWVTIPHVTQFDEADITELEAFRKLESESPNAAGVKLTLLAFVCKVVSQALRTFPQFNASLDETGANLILKQYINIGIAVDTPMGLVVPVIKDVPHLSVRDIAKDMQNLSQKARDKQLLPGDFSGGTFTISSLGGIGGTAFTPIVNYPEVAILGLSRAKVLAQFQKGAFVPRLMLPLSLSYDHRVIDGAEAARFTQYLSEHLSDIRRVLL